MITYCDVNTCEDCPRYGDDCDGDKRAEHTDYISRADAINAVHKYFVDKINNEPHEIDEDGDDVFTDMKSVNALFHHNKMVSKAIKALPSADAEPKRVLQGYCKGANCKWWNPQIKGCNRCVMIQDEYTHTSADAVDVYKVHEEEHLNIINRIKELQYAIAKTQTVVGKLVESADAVQGVECDHCVYKWGMKGGDE